MKRHNDRPIQDILNDVLKKTDLNKSYYDFKVREIWEKKLGALVQSQTEKIWFNGGTIYIQLNSAPLRAELLMGKEKIRMAFNNELGEELVKDIKLI